MKQLTIPTEALWTGDIDKSAARTSHTLKVEKLKIILQELQFIFTRKKWKEKAVN